MRSSVLDEKRLQEMRSRYAYNHSAPMPAPRPPYTSPLSTPARRHISLTPMEGWLPLILLAIALYSVVFSIIAAEWVSMSSLLLWSPILGIMAGFAIAKITRFPQSVLHLGTCLLGYWFAIWLTSAIAYHIPWQLVLSGLRAAFTGQAMPDVVPTSEIIFFFYLTFLCFFLGYFGSWLVYRAHLPWLVVLVYCSILLVNLNYVKRDFTYLVVIMIGALLLLVARMHLTNQVLQWMSEGLYTDRAWMRSITWRCMQIASVFTLLALLLSWLLPIQSQAAGGRTFWDTIDTGWNNVLNGRVSPQDPGSLFQSFQTPTNFFGDQMTISGSVHLPSGEVLYYSGPGGPHYLEGFAYNYFDGHTWKTALAATDTHPYDANEPLTGDTSRSDLARTVTTVTIVQPPGGTKQYIFAPAQPIQFDVKTVVYSDGTALAWTQQEPLTKNEQYRVVSDVPPSDMRTLSGIPLPNQNPQMWQDDLYFSHLASSYLQLPHDLSPDVARTALQWTQAAPDMYSKLKRLESHLSDQKMFTYSLTNAPIPNNVDVVDWLLQTRTGYCTYYASAMAIMGRLLGIPTRVVNGFSHGHYDTQRKVWSVNGVDAHSWVQAYFPTYGWVGFDPTPGFAPNAAPTTTSASPSQTPVATKPPVKPSPTVTPVTTKPQQHMTPPSARPAAQQGFISQSMAIGLAIAALLCSLFAFIFALVVYWWRGLYADSTLISGLFWRLCRIASWAGLSPMVWQTPYEYSRMLSRHFPQKATPLWRLTELFVRDRWGAPEQAPLPHEEVVATQLWPTLRSAGLRLLFRKRSV